MLGISRHHLFVFIILFSMVAVSFGRIPPSERKFSSPVIESTIDQITAKLKDPELATLFNNCFPNTLDTTVSNFTAKDASGYPNTFVITGDITAQWLRDSTNQVLPYLPFANPSAGGDPQLHLLICGLVNRQAADVLHDPFANAFNYADSGDGHQDDKRRPAMTKHVFEGKYELDSLAAFLKLSFGLYNYTGNFSCVNSAQWLSAVRLAVSTIKVMQAATSEDYNDPPYLFRRTTDEATDTLMMQGHGPVAARCGLSKCMFRPSDDAVTLPFPIAANAMAAVELEHVASMVADPAHPQLKDEQLAHDASVLAAEIRHAIQRYGIGSPAAAAGLAVYAYEVDGFGAQTFMDDANIPSLLSLPYLGFLPRSDPVYQATRSLVWSDRNPYFFSGTAGEGIGGPHEGMFYIWPMSIIMRALTSDSDDEILHCLHLLKTTTAGTNFMHESFYKDDPTDFTRKWFAWANSLFGELILTLARERPYLIF